VSRYFLVVIRDEHSSMDSPEALEAYLASLVEGSWLEGKVARVQRGGLLASKLMDETPPVRHRDQGVYR
jgi:hypothetical protein